MTRLALMSAFLTTTLLAAPVFADQPAVGTRIKIEAGNLAKIGETPSKANASRKAPKQPGVSLTVPAGFEVSIFAEGLSSARNMQVAANGDVFLAEQGAGKVTLLRDGNNDGSAELITPFASGFSTVYGLAFANNGIYVGDTKGVWYIPYKAGDTKASAQQVMVTPEGAFGSTGGHSTRNVNISPDGKKLYVSIGSAGNIAEEPVPRATIQEYTLDASGTKTTGSRTYASGLRNAVGTAFYPGTTDLYTVVNERDTLGDELVPDYLTRVADNGFYGWPYSYIGKNPQPGFADKRPDLVQKAIVPDVLLRSHSAPLGLTFYTADQFPKEYQGGAFVALHGSWNAANPRGYMVAFVPFANKRPVGDYQVFANGFWSGRGDTAEVWGRPAGVAVAKDGSLLVADDGSHTIWRVTYKK